MKFEVGDILVPIKIPENINFYVIKIVTISKGKNNFESFYEYEVLFNTAKNGHQVGIRDQRPFDSLEKYCKKASNPKLIKALYCD